MAKQKPLFKTGQVVRLATEWYEGEKKAEKYQRVTRVYPWFASKKYPYGYILANGDQANEKYLRALTEREAGR
jgi:hypothetical protein